MTPITTGYFLSETRKPVHRTKAQAMAEPASSAAGGIFAFKIAAAYGVPALLAAIVVMIIMRPRSLGEWTVALICTVVSSLCGGAMALSHFGLVHLANEGFTGLLAMGGVIFVCGLPGWVIVRAAFLWAERRKGKDLGELYADARRAAKEAM